METFIFLKIIASIGRRLNVNKFYIMLEVMLEEKKHKCFGGFYLGSIKHKIFFLISIYKPLSVKSADSTIKTATQYHRSVFGK